MAPVPTLTPARRTWYSARSPTPKGTGASRATPPAASSEVAANAGTAVHRLRWAFTRAPPSWHCAVVGVERVRAGEPPARPQPREGGRVCRGVLLGPPARAQ